MAGAERIIGVDTNPAKFVLAQAARRDRHA